MSVLQRLQVFAKGSIQEVRFANKHQYPVPTFSDI